MEGKACIKCGEWKTFEDFHKLKKSKDGHYTYCKSCKKEDDRLYRERNKEKLISKQKEYHQKNKEIRNAKSREYYHKNKEIIREKRKERDKRYREDNKELIKQRHKEWRKNNSERLKEQQDKWNKSDSFKKAQKKYKKSEKGRQSDYLSRIKRRSLKQKVSFSPFERKQILNRDKWKCQNCGCKVHDRSNGNWNTPNKAHIDHILPLSKGGDSKPSNLQTLCRTCNLSKHDNVELQLKLF